MGRKIERSSMGWRLLVKIQYCCLFYEELAFLPCLAPKFWFMWIDPQKRAFLKTQMSVTEQQNMQIDLNNKFGISPWISEEHDRNVFNHFQTFEQVYREFISFSPLEINNSIQGYQYRMEQRHPNICRVYFYHVSPFTHTPDTLNYCVYTDRMLPCKQYSRESFFTALKAVARLVEIYGPFKLTEKMICENEKREIKVWISEKWHKNSPDIELSSENDTFFDLLHIFKRKDEQSVGIFLNCRTLREAIQRAKTSYLPRNEGYTMHKSRSPVNPHLSSQLSTRYMVYPRNRQDVNRQQPPQRKQDHQHFANPIRLKEYQQADISNRSTSKPISKVQSKQPYPIVNTPIIRIEEDQLQKNVSSNNFLHAKAMLHTPNTTSKISFGKSITKPTPNVSSQKTNIEQKTSIENNPKHNPKHNPKSHMEHNQIYSANQTQCNGQLYYKYLTQNGQSQLSHQRASYLPMFDKDMSRQNAEASIQQNVDVSVFQPEQSLPYTGVAPSRTYEDKNKSNDKYKHFAKSEKSEKINKVPKFIVDRNKKKEGYQVESVVNHKRVEKIETQYAATQVGPNKSEAQESSAGVREYSKNEEQDDSLFSDAFNTGKDSSKKIRFKTTQFVIPQPGRRELAQGKNMNRMMHLMPYHQGVNQAFQIPYQISHQINSQVAMSMLNHSNGQASNQQSRDWRHKDQIKEDRLEQIDTAKTIELKEEKHQSERKKNNQEIKQQFRLLLDTQNNENKESEIVDKLSPRRLKQEMSSDSISAKEQENRGRVIKEKVQMKKAEFAELRMEAFRVLGPL